MTRQENATELIFKSFNKDELDRLKRNELLSLLSYIGLENYISRFPEARSYSYEIIKTKINEIKKEIEEDSYKYLFSQYANEEGLIDKDTMKTMLLNHLTSFSTEQVESLLDDLFKEKQFIEFSDFNKICIF